MATSGGLGDVQREITHALDVACGVQSGHHDAQVGGYRCLQYEQGEGLLFGGAAEGGSGDGWFGKVLGAFGSLLGFGGAKVDQALEAAGLSE